MTTPTELKPAGQTELYALLVEQMRPRLLHALEEAGKGQRLRVTSLPEPVMTGLALATCDGLVALDGIEDGHMTALTPGEALIWAQRSTDKRFTVRPQKITIRPRFTQHGGGTKTAVAGVTVR